MQPPAPPRFKRSILDRAMDLARLGQPTIMILRSLVRWPLRSALTMLGLGFAVASVISSSFLNDALESIVDQAFFQANRQDAILVFTQDVPITALAEVRRLPGVLQAEPQQFHAAILRNGPLEKRIGIEGRSHQTDLARVLTAGGTALTMEPGGVVLSDRLADQLDLRPGDTVEVEFLSGRRETLSMDVTGVVSQYFGLGAYADMDWLDAQFRQQTRMSVVNVTLDSTQIEALHEALKTLPRLSGLIMMTETRSAFRDTIRENVVIMNSIYITIAVLITVGVAYNGARIQLSERARELASLRILGFGRGEVSYILMGETMLIALLAQPLGWLLGAGIARLMTSAFSSDLYVIPLVLERDIFAQASLVVLAASLGSALIVRRRIDSMDLVSVMKTRE